MTDAAIQVPTLEQMAAALGPVDSEAAAALNPPESHEAFRLVGAQIGSARVLVDMRRILGLAFVFSEKATSAQKAKLKGFSRSLLTVAVHEALALEGMERDFLAAGTLDKQARVGSAAAVGSAFAAALALRDQAETAFRTVVGTDVAGRQRLSVAVGTAEDAEALASALGHLATFGHGLLQDAKRAKRAAVAGVDAAYVEELRAEAEALRAAAKGASGRLTANATSQGQLDTQDGLCIDLLSHIVHAFDAAHDRDGSIPRLTPQSTRRLLASRKKPRAANGAGAGAPTEAAGGTPEG